MTYRAPWWQLGPHVQTIVPAIATPVPRVALQNQA